MPSRALARGLFILALAVVGCALAVAAWAQGIEAATATAGKVADSFLGQGPLGAFIVAEALAIIGLSTVIVLLFRRHDDRSVTITAMVKEVTAALQANTAATAAGTLTIAALDRTLQATDDGVEKLSHQTELAAQAAAARGAEILKNQEDIRRRLEDRRA